MSAPPGLYSSKVPRFLLTDASPSSSENFNQGGIDSYIFTDHRSDLIMQCAQEILSLFILSIAAKVKSVGGETVYQDHAHDENRRPRDATRVARSVENSVFLELAREVVDAGLAHDITEAYTLIIPAFAHYGLLPDRIGPHVEIDRTTQSYAEAEKEEAADGEYDQNENIDEQERNAGGP